MILEFAFTVDPRLKVINLIRLVTLYKGASTALRSVRAGVMAKGFGKYLRLSRSDFAVYSTKATAITPPPPISLANVFDAASSSG